MCNITEQRIREIVREELAKAQPRILGPKIGPTTPIPLVNADAVVQAAQAARRLRTDTLPTAIKGGLEDNLG